jgi:hypothetical protein
VDFRLFDAVLDPVILVCDQRIVRYLNAAAASWLTLPHGEVAVDQPLSHYVDFSGSPELTDVGTLPFFAHSRYGVIQFSLKRSQYSGQVKLAVQRFPSDLHTLLYAIFVRDRAFSQVMSDKEFIDLKNPNLQKAAVEMQTEINTELTPDTTVAYLDELTITKAIPLGRVAKFESQANLFFASAQKACRGVTETITEDGVNVLIKSFPGLTIGLKCSLEVVGNVKLRGFSTMGDVTEVRPVHEDAVIHIKFGNLSPMARKSIDEFLETNAKKY